MSNFFYFFLICRYQIEIIFEDCKIFIYVIYDKIIMVFLLPLLKQNLAMVYLRGFPRVYDLELNWGLKSAFWIFADCGSHVE